MHYLPLEKMPAYQIALDFAIRIETLARTLLSEGAPYAAPLRHAALSIAASIAAGSVRPHRRPRGCWWLRPKGAAYRCMALLEILRRCSALAEGDYHLYREQLLEIILQLLRLQHSRVSHPP